MVLSDVPLEISGPFKCVVSAETTFETLTAQGQLTVVGKYTAITSRFGSFIMDCISLLGEMECLIYGLGSREIIETVM